MKRIKMKKPIQMIQQKTHVTVLQLVMNGSFGDCQSLSNIIVKDLYPNSYIPKIEFQASKNPIICLIKKLDFFKYYKSSVSRKTTRG